jgi:hypothetical protein
MDMAPPTRPRHHVQNPEAAVGGHLHTVHRTDALCLGREGGEQGQDLLLVGVGYIKASQVGVFGNIGEELVKAVELYFAILTEVQLALARKLASEVVGRHRVLKWFANNAVEFHIMVFFIKVRT